MKKLVILLSILFLGTAIFAGAPRKDLISEELLPLIESRDLTGLKERLIHFNNNGDFTNYTEEDSPELLRDAVKRGDIEVTKLLLEYNYPTVIKFYRYYDSDDFDGLQLGHWGSALYNRDSDMLQLLAKYKVPFYNFDISSIYRSSTADLQIIIDAGYELGSYILHDGFIKITTALDISLKSERVDLAEFLLENKLYQEDLIYHDIYDRDGGVLGVDPHPMFLPQRYPEYNELFKKYGFDLPEYSELTRYKEQRLLKDCDLGKQGESVRVLVSKSHFKTPPFIQYSYVINANNIMGLVERDSLK